MTLLKKRKEATVLKHLRTFLVAAIFAASALAQTQKPLTSEDVIRMIRAGLDESVIIKAIQANEPTFDTSTEGLIALKQAGVSQKIIEAMLDRSTQKALPVPRASDRPATPNSGGNLVVSREHVVDTPARADKEPPEGVAAPLPRENGIYYKDAGRFVQLFGKPVVRSETAGRSKAIWTLGISKVRSRAEIAGEHAQLQIAERQPTFYIVVPEGQTPESLTLLTLDREGNRRRFQVGSGGGVAGRSDSGYDMDDVHQVLIERIEPRLYRVTPAEELRSGEYGFVGVVTYATVGVASAGALVYDFGITKKR